MKFPVCWHPSLLRAKATFVIQQILTVGCLSLLQPVLVAQVAMTTEHNDLNRTGQNLNEKTLNTSNTKVTTFGKLFTLSVDGQIYAQPLYMPNLAIGGATRNVVFVATENNSLYAFDADNPSAPTLWHQNFGTPVPTSDVRAGCSDIYPQAGITSTPVIDTGSNTIYVVAKTKDTSNTTYHFKLHALDLISGAEKFGGPVEVAGSVKGTGWNSSGGNVSFLALYQNNRPGLLLMNGTVYVAFGGMCEYLWHGWLFGYSASNLANSPLIYNTTPNGKEGGIWGGGQGLVGENGFIYFMTGNGTFDANTSGSDYGESFMKINTSGGLSVTDWFTPDDVVTLNNEDADIGSGGPMALPGTNLIVGMGKDGILRLVDTENMGHYNSGANADVQEFVATSGVFMGAPIYWDSPNRGPVVYLWGGGDSLKAYEFNGSSFATSPASQSTMTSSAGYSNSSPLSISSNGSQAGTGILWASSPYSGNANHLTVPGILRAFDATNLTSELWDTQMDVTRDGVGNYAKFSPPTIANGKVYLPTFSNQLLVYGLLGPNTSNGMLQVNSAPSTLQASNSSVSATFTNPQIAGDLNVVAVGWGDNTSIVSSVTDSRGNTYVRAVGPTSISGLQHSIYYAKNIAGGSNTVTVKFNEAAAYPDVRILEYTGLDKNNPLDVATGAAGSGASASSGSITTTSANDLIFGAGNTVGTAFTFPGAGFVQRIINNYGSIAEDKLVKTTGSYAATATNSSNNWVLQMVAFRRSGSTSSNPTVTAVSPSSGSINGGTAVTITGTGFASGASVTFGGTAASSVTVVSSTSITAKTPAHTAGTVNVVVTNSNGQNGTLTSGYTYTSGSGTISFVQVNSAPSTVQASNSSVSAAYSSAQTAGNLNVVVVAWGDNTSTVSSVTDSRGNSYALAVGPTATTGLQESIYYAKNILGGSNTVTVKFNQAAAYPDVRILEYSGLSKTSPLDATMAGTGNGTAASSGTATTSSANELIFGAGNSADHFTATGSGFSKRIINVYGNIAEDKIVSSAGSYAATASNYTSYWVMQMVTFK